MRVTNDDVRIDVRVDGDSGDAVVLLSGLALTREIWNRQAEILAEKHRVIRPEFRGTGATNVPEGPYLMESLAGDVAAVLDALGIERAAVVGHSLGGYVAIAFARMYAERVARLALVCSRIEADSPEMSKIRYELADRVELEKSSAPVTEWLCPRMLAPSAYADDSAVALRLREMMNVADPAGLAAMLRGMAVRDAGTDIAPDLPIPVLVVAGALDQSIPVDEARATASAFPNSRLVVMAGSGHAPMLEEPERLGQVLAEFLNGA
ncbi:MAG: alpha/beta hydrolase [Candidatus Eremiobacteraeota bacterium]|nr:alpha/beta hydrolase [Candidatus Eremiobacteraeota bacterium]